MGVIGFLHGFETLHQPAGALAGPPKRKQEQEHGERDGDVVQR